MFNTHIYVYVYLVNRNHQIGACFRFVVNRSHQTKAVFKVVYDEPESPDKGTCFR